MIDRYSFPEISRIWQDEFKFKTMLDIELLVIEYYVGRRIIPASALSRIRKRARFNVSRIRKIEAKTHHDIVAFVTNVTQYIGTDAQYFHRGLTSSDLLDTTLGVQLAKASDILLRDLSQLREVLARKARKYKDMVCIGRTHGVHAEPMTFGLKLALWYEETKRNIARLKQAQEAVSVGKMSGAVGTFANIDPRAEEFICRRLGLRPAPISTQVIQRDVYAEYLCILAVVAASLEKFATEIRHLQKTEVREVEEPFARGQKGSSAMPHKRNPVVCERICGLARIVRANALVGLEDVALWHERDISHSSCERVILPDSTIALDYMLRKLIQVVDGLLVYPEAMLENLVKTKGLIFSQRVLIRLMQQGLPRTQAYDIVQRLAMRSWKEGADFKQLLLDEPQARKHLNQRQIEEIFTLEYYLRNVDKIYKRLGL